MNKSWSSIAEMHPKLLLKWSQTETVMQFFIPDFSISQEIGLSEFLHEHFIHGQTTLFIHEKHIGKLPPSTDLSPPPLRVGI